MKKQAKRRAKAASSVQLRIQTRDAFTNVYETHPDGEGFSWKMYGPFATADEQRAFMREVCEAAPMTSEEDRTSILASIDAWVRFDEEDDYLLHATVTLPPATSAVAVPIADEARVQSGDEDLAMHIKWIIDGIHMRPVTGS